MAPLGGVERPRRMVRFARLIHRRGRVLGGPSARAASGGNPIPPASPPRVVCSAPCWCPPTGMPAMERERRRRHTTHLDLGRAAGEPGARRTALRLLRQLHRGRQRVGRVDRLAAQDRRLHSDDPSLALPARDELRRPDAPGPRHVPTDRRGHLPGLPGPIHLWQRRMDRRLHPRRPDPLQPAAGPGRAGHPASAAPSLDPYQPDRTCARAGGRPAARRRTRRHG